MYSSDALVQYGGIPGHIQIDQYGGRLKLQACAARNVVKYRIEKIGVEDCLLYSASQGFVQHS